VSSARAVSWCNAIGAFMELSESLRNEVNIAV
jgi:hypothetical protein